MVKEESRFHDYFFNKSVGKMIRRKVYIDVRSSNTHAKKQKIRAFRRDFPRLQRRQHDGKEEVK